MKRLLVLLALLCLTPACEKLSPAMFDYLCGNPIVWYNPHHREAIIEVDTCNTTFYLYPEDTIFTHDAADPLDQCYHDMPFKIWIMIDGRTWVFWQKGFILDANTIN